jgi:hypothetical protein
MERSNEPLPLPLLEWFSELDPTERHWIIAAYMARRLAEGDVEWKRD